MHTLQKRGLLFNKVVPSKTVSSAYTDQYICWQQKCVSNEYYSILHNYMHR